MSSLLIEIYHAIQYCVLATNELMNEEAKFISLFLTNSSTGK